MYTIMINYDRKFEIRNSLFRSTLCRNNDWLFYVFCWIFIRLFCGCNVLFYVYFLYIDMVK